MKSHLEDYDEEVHVTKFTARIGDWSCDGHEKSYDPVIATSLSVEQVTEGLQRGWSLAGLDNFAPFCEESNYIPAQATPLVLDVLPGSYGNSHLFSGKLFMAGHDWLEFKIGLVKLAYPTARFALVQPPPSIYLGGYGLFD